MPALKQHIIRLAAECGAAKVGIAAVAPVSPSAEQMMQAWLRSGRHAEMTYMERNTDVRRNPALLLDGARSLVVCAFNYYNPPAPDAPYKVSCYALGRDYHKVLKRRLQPVVAALADAGHTARICIDSAPLRERYWATQAGVGFIGRNNQLIVPGIGSYVVLATILTDAHLEPDTPLDTHCPAACARCIDACPGHALAPQSAVDARRCLSYLTIEHKGDMPGGYNPRRHLFGCDVCQDVCPFNAHVATTTIPEFRSTPGQDPRYITAAELFSLNSEQFTARFAGTPIHRAGLAGLQRNMRAADTTEGS